MSLLCSTAEKVHNQDLSVLATKLEKDPLNGMDCESANIRREIGTEK